MSEKNPQTPPGPVESVGPIVFLGDCHLAVGDPDRTRLVLECLESLSGEAARVILLGDLFDFWLGTKHLQLPDFAGALDKLRELTDSGLDLSLIRGNRDFLLDEHFTRRTGVRLLDDYEVVEAAGKKLRLTHGDLLCTRDWRYRIWRVVVRNRITRATIALMPLFLTRWVAIQMRRFSQSEISRKGFRRLGFVKQAAVEALDGVDALIVGHAHSPQTIAVEVCGEEKLVYVAGDWKEVGCFVCLDKEGLHHRAWPSQDGRPVEVPHRSSWNDGGELTRIEEPSP